MPEYRRTKAGRLKLNRIQHLGYWADRSSRHYRFDCEFDGLRRCSPCVSVWIGRIFKITQINLISNYFDSFHIYRYALRYEVFVHIVRFATQIQVHLLRLEPLKRESVSKASLGRLNLWIKPAYIPSTPVYELLAIFLPISMLPKRINYETYLAFLKISNWRQPSPIMRHFRRCFFTSMASRPRSISRDLEVLMQNQNKKKLKELISLHRP